MSDNRSPMLGRVRELYESTQAEAERIPWEWLARSVGRVARPGGRRSHLIAAVDPGGMPVGFVTGSFIPGYGGYVSYLGVDPMARTRGVGSALFACIFGLFRDDADAAGEPLPFVVWESRPPLPGAGPAAEANWRARLRLFEKVGSRAVEGMAFLSPNYLHPDEPPFALRLFVRPFDVSADDFGPTELRAVAAGLYAGVYGEGPGDAVYDGTLTPTCRPALAPAGPAAVLAG